MVSEIRGVISPVLTPIAKDGSVAENRIADSVEFSLECGCHAIVAAGTGSQETASLTPSERMHLITETVRAVDGEVPVLGGVSHPALPIVSKLIDHAESAGVDAVIAMPPWGDIPSDEAIFRYYEHIAQKTELPVAVYNNPTISVDMTKETMRRVAQIEGVAHLKESQRDWQKIRWLIENIQSAGHAEMHTTMDVFVQTIQAGGSGAFIPAPATKPAMRAWKALEDEDIDKAIDHQRAFVSFPPAAANGFIPACKAGAALCGYDLGPPRPPFDPIEPTGHDAVAEWLKTHTPELLDGDRP